MCNSLVYRLSNFFTGYSEKLQNCVALSPISVSLSFSSHPQTESCKQAICVVLWFIIVIIAPVSDVPLIRKARIFKFYSDQILLQIEGTKQTKAAGLFSYPNLLYTNVPDFRTPYL